MNKEYYEALARDRKFNKMRAAESHLSSYYDRFEQEHVVDLIPVYSNSELKMKRDFVPGSYSLSSGTRTYDSKTAKWLSRDHISELGHNLLKSTGKFNLGNWQLTLKLNRLEVILDNLVSSKEITIYELITLLKYIERLSLLKSKNNSIKHAVKFSEFDALYLFVANSSVNLIDPNGEIWVYVAVTCGVAVAIWVAYEHGTNWKKCKGKRDTSKGEISERMKENWKDFRKKMTGH